MLDKDLFKIFFCKRLSLIMENKFYTNLQKINKILEIFNLIQKDQI